MARDVTSCMALTFAEILHKMEQFTCKEIEAINTPNHFTCLKEGGLCKYCINSLKLNIFVFSLSLAICGGHSLPDRRCGWLSV
jgi:hypothetical protein